MATVPSESKVAVLTDASLLEVFKSGAFKADSKQEVVFDDEMITIEIPARVYYRHAVTGADGTRYSVGTVVNYAKALEMAEDEKAECQFFAKLGGDQSKIKGRDSSAELADGGERYFEIVPLSSILEPGRADGGFRFSPQKFIKIVEKREKGQELTEEEAEYLADNIEAAKAHFAMQSALGAAIGKV